MKYTARMQRYLTYELRKHNIIKGSQLGFNGTFGQTFTVTGYGPQVEQLHIMKMSFAYDEKAEEILKSIEKYR